MVAEQDAVRREDPIVSAELRQGFDGKPFHRIVRQTRGGVQHVIHHEPGTRLKQRDNLAAVRRVQAGQNNGHRR